MELHWLLNDGGPLAVLPRNPQTRWKGEGGSMGAPEAHSDSAVNGISTDYDRACDVKESAEVLKAGDGWVLVLGGAVDRAAWYKPSGSAEFSVISVEHMHDASDDALATLYDSRSNQEWRVLTPILNIGPGGLLLMHAAGRPGEEDERSHDQPGPSFIGDAITFPAKPGRYRVEVSNIIASPGPGEGSATLVLFTPA